MRTPIILKNRLIVKNKLMAEEVFLTRQTLLDMLTEETYDIAFIAFLKDENVHAQIVGSPNNVSKIFGGILIHDPDWATSMIQGVYSAMVHLIAILEKGSKEEAKIAGDKLTKIGPGFEELAEAIRKLSMDSAARAINEMIIESKEGEQDDSKSNKP